MRFHDLRHTYASLLIADNIHPKRIQSLLGHSSIQITMDTYGHLMSLPRDSTAEGVADLVFGSSGSNMLAIQPLPIAPTRNSLIEMVARQLNERPRQTLEFETPTERFSACVASTG
jgi:hypothetical protein